MDYEHLSYRDAIEKIAAITNFQLDYEDENYKPKKIVVNIKPKKKEEKKSWGFGGVIRNSEPKNCSPSPDSPFSRLQTTIIWGRSTMNKGNSNEHELHLGGVPLPRIINY